MSIILVRLKPESVMSHDERRNGAKVSTYNRTYTVVSNDPNETSGTVKNAAVLFGSPIAEDPYAYCYKREARIVNNGKKIVWEVMCEWSSDDSQHGATSPIYPDMLAKVSGSWDQKEVPVSKDLDGNPIVNTAKELFDPPHSEPLPIPTRTIIVNLSSDYYSDDWDDAYFNAVNESTAYGKPAGTLLVQDMAFTPEEWTNEDGDTVFYRAYTIKIAYNKDGWQPRLLSQGYRDINGRHIREPNTGKPVSSPVPLDDMGNGLFGTDVDNAAIVTPTTKNEADFSDIIFAFE